MRTWPLLLALLFLLSSCATPIRRAEENGRPADAGQELSGSAAEEGTHAARGLEIRSRPSAAVYLNSRYRGDTPLVLTDLEPGRYRLELRKAGFHPVTAWIRCDAGYMLYEFELEEISGFLRVLTRPSAAEILLDEVIIAADAPVKLPAGVHALRLRAFGYEDLTAEVTVSEARTTLLELQMEEAPFRLTDLSLSRGSFNPADAGLLGQVRVSFRVTAPGEAAVTVLDHALKPVVGFTLDPFQGWDQQFRWSGRSAEGLPLPDGLYRIRVEARGRNGATDTREADVRIDSSGALTHRSLWSGSAGLLFAPSPEILPPGATQFSTLALARVAGGEARAPWNAALRLGLPAALELDLEGGFTVGGDVGGGDEPAWPFFVSAALKSRLFAAGSAPRLEGALQALLSYQHTLADSLSNFTGLSAALPCSLSWGPLQFLASPQIIVSPWSVAYDRTLNLDQADWGIRHWRIWLYGRTGLLWDAGSWRLGISAAFRSSPLTDGPVLDPPFQAGGELHWLIPGTQLYLSLALAGEIGAEESFSLGGGLGLID